MRRTLPACIARVGLCGLALAVSACWADFPDGRFLWDTLPSPDTRSYDSHLFPPLDVGHDVVGPRDLGPRDAAGDRGDGLAVDLPESDLHKSDLPKSDLPKSDLPKPTHDLPKPDVFVCTPGAYVGCAGKTLQRCNAAGDGLVTTNCGSASCSTTLHRCDQCDPTSPPSCQNGDARTCSDDGLYVTTQCPQGCLAGVCCRDVDQDGSFCTDCDDDDKDVFPGQTTYFDTPRKSGGYDYNCSNSESRELPDLAACIGAGANCSGEGWVGSVPACGQNGQFATCAKVSGNCVAQAPAPRKQRCR